MLNIFGVYKPKGPTSNYVVQKIKRVTGQKVGHAGTLDPLAKGILVVGVGREATKQLSTYVQKEKEYLATIKLGYTSTTDDAEGEKTKVEFKAKPTKKDVENAVKKFKGKISQVPPIFSAIKIDGKEAYKHARKGKKVKMNAREVEIKKLKIKSYKWPNLKISVTTGPGTYIRSLARDIGESLKTGGYLSDLERTRVGTFTKKNAKTITQIKKLASLAKKV